MFVNHCTECDQRQLIFPSQVTGVTETSAGSALSYTCWCGATQSWLFARAEQPHRTAA